MQVILSVSNGQVGESIFDMSDKWRAEEGRDWGLMDHNILGPIYDEGAQEDICTARLIPQISLEICMGYFPGIKGTNGTHFRHTGVG